jgi:hypothetical protein
LQRLPQFQYFFLRKLVKAPDGLQYRFLRFVLRIGKGDDPPETAGDTLFLVSEEQCKVVLTATGYLLPGNPSLYKIRPVGYQFGTLVNTIAVHPEHFPVQQTIYQKYYGGYQYNQHGQQAKAVAADEQGVEKEGKKDTGYDKGDYGRFFYYKFIIRYGCSNFHKGS